jgi:hypothetical protein
MAKDDKTTHLDELREKVEHNELRARDAEARVRIVEAELKLLELRPKLSQLKEQS